MGKRGPKAYKADWNQIEKMCALHCTGEEIADMLDIDYDTLQRACNRDHSIKLAEWIRQKSSHGKLSLRRKQFTTAMDGNVTMLIWLGKNWLDQKDKSDEEIDAMKDMPKSFNLTFNEVDASKPE